MSAIDPKDGYVLIKRGYYYRPNAAGYTANLSEAGIYSDEESAPHIHEGVTRKTFAEAFAEHPYASPSSTPTQKQEPVAVEVKPLEWIEDGDGHWKANALTGLYHIVRFVGGGMMYRLHLSWSLLTSDGDFDTLDAAKAAAQSDYESRIKSALIASPAQVVSEEMIEAAAKAIYDAEDALSGDSIATVIVSSDHLFPQQKHVVGNPTSKAYHLAAMDVCRTAARAALEAALSHDKGE